MYGSEFDLTKPLDSAIAMSYGGGRVTMSSPSGKLCLSFIGGLCAGRTGLFLTKVRTSIGRAENCDIVLDGDTVSRLHCEIIQFGAVYVLRDFSRNGTFINGQRVQQTQLNDGDQLRVGQNIVQIHLTTSVATSTLKARETMPNRLPPVIELTPHIVVKGLEEGVTQPFSEEKITIGRRTDNQVVLDADNISRNHASIERLSGKYFIRDLDSANGVYVNEQKVDLVELNDGDRVRIGNYTLIVNLCNFDCILNFKRPTK